MFDGGRGFCLMGEGGFVWWGKGVLFDGGRGFCLMGEEGFV